MRAPIVWRVATVRGAMDETPRARTLLLHVPDWPGGLPGSVAGVRSFAPFASGCPRPAARPEYVVQMPQ